MYGVCALTSEFFIGDSTVYDMTHHAEKSSQIRDSILFTSAIVKPEHLFINIAIQMERLNADVGAFQSALEQAPKIFQPVCVNLPVDVPLGMVDYLMREILMCQSA